VVEVCINTWATRVHDPQPLPAILSYLFGVKKNCVHIFGNSGHLGDKRPIDGIDMSPSSSTSSQLALSPPTFPLDDRSFIFSFPFLFSVRFVFVLNQYISIATYAL
jgi:hypothetical protein